MMAYCSRKLLLVARRRIEPLSLKARTLSSSSSPEQDSLRIAIVGGGVAGLSSALHLTELVERGLVESIDIYGDSPAKRDIGVGVWSTALTPFSASYTRPSHQIVWDDWMHAGQWLGEVGYKSPSGAWLATSTLPTEGSFADFPGLFFLRERDLISTLEKAVEWEVSTAGTIQMHKQSRVVGIESTVHHPWSAQLQLEDGSVTDRDYHVIIGADGTHSNLRQRYGGGTNSARTRLTGTNVFNNSGGGEDEQSQQWKAQGQAEANAIEDRNFTVLRGNSPLDNNEIGMNGVSFQTWGEGQSMRFATVPLSYPDGGDRVENQVWFATTSDESIVSEPDATVRKEKLIQAFSSWHDPIQRIMEATPADEILVERAIAHRHSVGPVLNVNRVMHAQHSGPPGPVICFVGDSFMTVDPILAQGFTMALEGAHALNHPIEAACAAQSSMKDDGLNFDPYVLRQELQDRFERRSHRLVSLLRATELVQALGQPQASLFGFVAKKFLRPAMQLTPNAVKAPIFNAILKYSLGK